MSELPRDPVMLLSVINTKLRDFYPDLESLCREHQVEKNELMEKLRQIDYEYDREQNQFV